MVPHHHGISLRILTTERKTELKIELKKLEFNIMHDLLVDPQPIPYREIRDINGKQTDVGGKACNVSPGCGETIHRLFQNRLELSDEQFHICDICMNCGTLFCIM